LLNVAATLAAAPPSLTHTDHCLLRGRLGAAGGVTVVPGVPDANIVVALALEATSNYVSATRQVCVRSDGAEGRGGVPRRALTSAGGGPVQDALYASPMLNGLLSSLCGARVLPSGNRGSYSYYVEPGDFLDVHLDIPTCDVTLITVLDDKAPGGESGGALEAFPLAVGAPLSMIREHGYPGGRVVKAEPGQSIVILGGLVPHRVLALKAGGQRVISALCFKCQG
jgi:hypothetical protein